MIDYYTSRHAHLNKVVRIGTVRLWSYRRASLYVHIEVNEKDEASFTGVIGPYPGGNCAGSCGQIIMERWDIGKLAPHWTLAMVDMLRRLWDKYHLKHTPVEPLDLEWIRNLPKPDREPAWI